MRTVLFDSSFCRSKRKLMAIIFIFFINTNNNFDKRQQQSSTSSLKQRHCKEQPLEQSIEKHDIHLLSHFIEETMMKENDDGSSKNPDETVTVLPSPQIETRLTKDTATEPDEHSNLSVLSQQQYMASSSSIFPSSLSSSSNSSSSSLPSSVSTFSSSPESSLLPLSFIPSNYVSTTSSSPSSASSCTPSLSFPHLSSFASSLFDANLLQSLMIPLSPSIPFSVLHSKVSESRAILLKVFSLFETLLKEKEKIENENQSLKTNLFNLHQRLKEREEELFFFKEPKSKRN